MNGAIKKPVSTDAGETKPPPPAGLLPCRDSTESAAGEFWLIAGAVARFLGAAGGVALVTAVIRAAAPRWHLANLSMLYLLVILATAVLAGRVPAIVSALLSFLAVDWYFVHPVGHWTVSNPDEWVTLMIFLVSSLVTGQMAAILRTRAEEARLREREMATLYELGTATAGQAELGPILTFLAERVKESFGGAPCEFLLWDRAEQLRPLDLPSASPPGPVTEFALRSGQRDFGCMRVGRRADGWPLTQADRRLLSAFARHAAMAIDRGRLAHEAHEARLLRDSDALKTTLLSAVSHDL